MIEQLDSPSIQSDVESEIKRRLADERAKLRRETGLVQIRPFQRPMERSFTAEERDKVTILFGGLTAKHEALIQAVFRGAGYKCEILPVPDVPAFQAGKEFGNNGQCNPTYFTVGNLVQYLQRLEAGGMSRNDIIDNHVFFTAGSCGPCRFGMYEAEYRFALQNAGYDGFRVLLFQQQEGINAKSGEAGLKFNVDFGLGMLNALHLGDTMNEMAYLIRPYETTKGETNRVFDEAMSRLVTLLKDRKHFEIMEQSPGWVQNYLADRKGVRNPSNTIGKIREHLYGDVFIDTIDEVRNLINTIEVDRFKVKPIVKITGEFWAQTTEGDGNFNMFRFLEREGAEVKVEPIATWVAYLCHQAKTIARNKHDVESHAHPLAWHEFRKRLTRAMNLQKKVFGLHMGEVLWSHFYHRIIDKLGGTAHHLIPQDELAALAHPFYHKMSRGGEGHLEIGKNIYYHIHHLTHMVLAVKPFGCMPSSQSDGVQSAVVNKYRDMIFLPIETSGEGEVNAHSRVQMALGEAKAKAKLEFETVLQSCGKTLPDLRSYVADHPELKRPLYKVPHKEGVAGTAAHFAAHVSDLMDRRRRFWPQRSSSPKPNYA
ncbi:MAG: activator of (R)-2-hydroxyglutaryl-CoA dehydratase [Bryobacteraceae bacterium]